MRFWMRLREWGRVTFKRRTLGWVAQNEQTRSGFSAPAFPAIPDSVEQAEQTIRFQSFETAHVWSADEIYLFGKNGQESKIVFDDDEMPLIKNSIITHNHPSGSHFSRPDIRFIADLNPAEFRVVTAQTRYVVQRPTQGWPANLFEQYEKIFVIVYKRNVKDYQNGKINEAALNRRIYADAAKRSVRELRLTYREEAF